MLTRSTRSIRSSRLSALPLLLAACIGPALLPAVEAAAHCQVPCGIYGDELKLQELQQHVDTIVKAAAQIEELADATDAQSHQQLVRWVNNKETHAEKVMSEMQSYFLAQRVALPAEGASAEDLSAYAHKLASIHSVIVHAMKAKQNAAPAHAEALREALTHFQGLYLGKTHSSHDHGHDHADGGHSH